MKKYDIYRYSNCLNRNMNIKVYGHFGTPIIVFPCQNSMSNDFENFGMIAELSDYIENGQIKLYCVDSVDAESYSDASGDAGHRAWIADQYFHYIINEVLPIIYDDCGGFVLPYVTGCSMGANHSVNMFCRRPDLFKGVLALSGCYDNNMFFGNWCDNKLYDNSPLAYLSNLDPNHYYIDLYNQKKIILCCGQGNWEEEAVRTLHILDNIFKQKNIHAWIDFWGYDVAHDWPWWKKQYRYFLPKLLED